MKFTAVLILVSAVLIGFTIAEDVQEDAGQRDIPERVPRVTCDIIGSDRMCAVRCIAMGYRGGFCNAKKICECRR